MDRELADGLFGSSHAIRRLHNAIRAAGSCDVGVLLTGEIGTGKAAAARAIHDASARRNGPFSVLECEASTAPLLERELFGERDVATGETGCGLLARAAGGTVVFNEIAALPASLHVPVRRWVDGLATGSPNAQDTRVIATTSRDLADLARRGAFDVYLFLRVSEMTIGVPSLRSRRDDLPHLVDSLLPYLCRRNRLPPVAVSRDALDRMARHTWPGNLRELEFVLERAAALTDGGVICSADLQLSEPSGTRPRSRADS